MLAGVGARGPLGASPGTAAVEPPQDTCDADLSCREEGCGWDKESPSPPVNKPALRIDARRTIGDTTGSCTTSNTRRAAATSDVRASPLRRSRPGQRMPFAGGPREEKIDVLLKMLRAEGKFQPMRTEDRGEVGRALCHTVSPFVAERRRWFVAWKNQMASFLGYSRDTVAVALNYFDRYTCARPCNATLAQAVAATALHIAAKFEESNPASLRQLLKFTPVFTPEQLLMMEMSMLKVLNWDLRPVTIYDFVRAFCDLLPAAGFSRMGRGRVRPIRVEEDDEQELRVGAEEIAELSACEIAVVEFLPSTLAISALLLSASRAEAVTSHYDVLDTCAALGTISLDRVLECIRLLGSSLAKRYPAASAAADIAGDHVSRYTGSDSDGTDSDDSEVGEASANAECAEVAAAVVSIAVSPLGAPLKKRRCSTPTGVDGILHIEMAAIRTASADGSASSGSPSSGISDTAAASTVGAATTLGSSQSSGRLAGTSDAAAAGVATVSGGGDGEGEDVNHPRPMPRGVGGGSTRHNRPFSFSDDIGFAAPAKKGMVGSMIVAGAPTDSAPATSSTSATLGKPWYPSTAAGVEVEQRVERVLSGRKRSADALGHCESGSGFGAPPPRMNKVAVPVTVTVVSASTSGGSATTRTTG